MLICSAQLAPSFFRDVAGVIFDCDGVLFDSWNANKTFYNAVLAELGLPPMAPEDEAYVHAHAVHESYARIVPAERLHEVGEAARRVDYAANVLPSLELEPGLVDLLEDLMAASVRLGIDTNRTTTLDMVVERFGFERYFSPIVGAHMAGPKPDPASVALILREWGIAASQVAFVGDSSVDEATAKAAGVRFWAYKNGNLDAELYVPDFPTLRAALQKCYAAS